LSGESGAGFTMIELIIAIFVLTVAVIGVYGAFSMMVITTAQMSDRFTASYLAQEGIEVVRNIRDNNWLQENDWRCGLTDLPEGAGECSVGNQDFSQNTGGAEADYKTGTSVGTGLTPYGASGRYLKLDSSNSNNFYNYLSGSDTKLKRRIIINTVNDYIIQVLVTVSWDEKSTIINPNGQNSITAEEYLYNWY